jgi:hypothetical protein
MVEPYLHCPTCLHGTVLNSAGTGTVQHYESSEITWEFRIIDCVEALKTVMALNEGGR